VTTPQPSPLPQRRIRCIVAVLLLGMTLSSLDQTIVNTALPTIAGDLGGLDRLSWVVAAFLLASMATMPLWGKFGDLYGRKRFFLAATVIFLVSSALAGISSSMDELIAYRALQGLGSAGLSMTAQSMLAEVVAPRERGRYTGLFGVVSAVSLIAGPPIGGVLVESLSWRWIFYVNLPLGAVALIAALAWLPDRARPPVARHTDYQGAVLIVATSVALILFTTWGGTTFPWTSVPELTALATVVVGAGAFVLVERRVTEPVLPLRLFSNRVFAICAATAFATGAAMFGGVTYLPQFLQLVQGHAPALAGLRLLPATAGMLIASVASGRLISRFGRYKVFPVLGTAGILTGLILFAGMTPGTGPLATSLSMVVFGAGLGMVLEVLFTAVQNTVSYHELGIATSALGFFRQAGASLGVAGLGVVLTGRLDSNLAREFGSHWPTGLATSAGPSAVTQLPPAMRAGFVHAYADSLSTVFLIAAPIAAVAFALAWLLPERPLHRTVSSARAETGEAAELSA
jgi:EmrB/QacA subfamily drug resistance transporter